LNSGSDSGEQAHPAALPGLPEKAELLAAVYGELIEDPDSAVVREPWSLFHERSLAMGWLTDVGKRGTVTIDEVTGRVTIRDATDVGSVGLWDVHDAGRGQEVGSAPACALWVQVGIGPAPPDRPLPVQALLTCVDDVATRIGRLTVDAVQILLPVQQLSTAIPRNSTLPSLATMAWFADHDPGRRTPLEVTLDGGRHPSIRSAAPQMQTWMQQAEQDVFACDSISLTEHVELALRPVFFDGLWREPTHQRVTLRGTLASWSLDALGWLAAFVADVSAWHAVTTPLLLTVGLPG
jgi:hypothetical protein